MLKRLLLSFLITVVTVAAVCAQCPTITGPAISTNQACVGDVVTLTMSGGTNLIPSAQTVDWYSGSTPGFDPLTQGSYVGSAQIVGSGTPCSDPPIVLGGLINPCNGSNPNNGSEENEAMLIWSAGGFNGSDLGVGVNNLGAPSTANIGTLGPCPLLAVPTVSAAGGCVVLAGPATVVPPNAFVLVFTSSEADINFDFSGLCALGFPIYVFQNSCTRLMGPTVPGAFSNIGPQSYAAVFGCPGPNQSLTYNGSTGNNTFTAGWTVLGINFPAPCNGIPFIPAPPTVPVSSVTIDPLNVTITSADCGQQYYSAIVTPPVAGCPSQTGVGGLSLFVECPVLDITGVETVCIGQPTSVQVNFSGHPPPYTFVYRINGVPQPPVTTSDNPYIIPFTPSSAGSYSIDLESSSSSTCTPTLMGIANVTATPGGPAMPLSTTVCAIDQPIDLTVLEDPAFPGGTWSGSFVTGTSFDAGSSASGSFTVTYTPPTGSGCSTPGTSTITITAPTPIVLGIPPTLCGPTTYDLNQLLPAGSPPGNWSGPNLTLPSTFNAPPIGGVGGTFIFTYTPTSGCFAPAMVSILVSAGSNAAPLDATICALDQPFDLTALEDPAAPGGTWSGANVVGTSFDAGSSASGVYSITYTPSGTGGCTNPGTSTITVTPVSPNPTVAVAACEGVPVDLAAIVGAGTTLVFSHPDITPAGIYTPPPGFTGTFNYTALTTPTPGICIAGYDFMVIVDPAIPISLNNVTVCEGSGPFDLNSLFTSGSVAGNWTGTGVSGSFFDVNSVGVGTYTVDFSPSSGACNSSGSATITVNANAAPTLGTATVCVTDPLFDLTNLQDPSFPTGTWSGSGVSGTNFNPSSVGVGTTTLTFTPSGGSACEGPSITTITVTNANTPTLGTTSLCQTDPSFDLTTLEDPLFPTGTWSGPGVSGSNFSATAAGPGSITITFTPVSGSCAAAAITTITVNAAGPSQPLDATICAADQPLDLTTLEDPAAPGGTWTGANVTGTTFNAGLSASGTFTVTYIPPAGGCASPGTANITISSSGTPTLGTATVCINDGLFDLISIQDPAYSSGVWSGAGVSGSFFDQTLTGIGTYSVTFTPLGSCINVASTNIVVSNSTTPVTADATLCVSDAPLELATLEDPAFSGGTWSGLGVSGGFFDPSITSTGSYTLTYSSSGTCVSDAFSVVTVTPSNSPVLATAASCETETIDLTLLQDPAFPAGTWSGTSVTGTTFSAAGLPPAVYTLTFTPTSACAQASTTEVTVFLAAPTSGRDTIICAGSAAFGLDMMLNGGPIAGTWSGPGVAAGQFDAPNVASGTYGLTFTPATGVCALPSMIQVTVQVSGTPTIADQNVCTSSPVIDLNALVPAAYAGGIWSGPNVAANSFDPSAVPAGNYRVVYTPGGTCTSPVTITISVSASITLSLPTLSYCLDAGSVDLTTLDPAAAPGGVWSGPGVTGNFLDPSVAGPGNYTLAYTPPAGGCATNAATTFLEISPLTTVGIFTDTVCAGSGPIDLSAQLDPSFAVGSWSGSSVTSAGNYTPINTAGPDQVTFTPQGGCYSAAQFTFDVVGVSTLSVGQPIFTCAPDGQTYIATISVTTTLNNGTITTSLGALVGSVLTITGLVSGTTNFVTIDDAATCNAPITVDVSFACPAANCTTEAGTLIGGPYQLCSMTPLTNNGVTGSINDGDDLVFYYLDDDTDPDNGFLSQQSTFDFTEPAGFAYQTLFVYALAGNDNGTGGISALDTCRSQSNALEVTWAAPIIAIAGAPVCNAAEDEYTVEITVSGGWSSYREVTSSPGSFSSATVFNAGPFPSGSSNLLAFSDSQNCEPAAITVTYDCSDPCVLPDPGSFDNSPLLLCDLYLTDGNYNNDEVLGANDVQVFIIYSDAAGGVELARFPSLPIDLASLGLTSGIVYISSLAGENDGSGGISNTCFAESQLRAIQLGQTQFVNFDTTVCSGTIVTIQGTTYTETSNTGSYTSSGFGASCDTIVNVTVNFSTAGGTTIDRTDVICNDEILVIGGQTFSASNPSDTFTVGATACDTTYRVALTVLPPTDSLLRDTLCFGDSLVVGNQVYNFMNPTGVSILRARNGCDSIVTVEVEFVRPPVVSIVGAPSYCQGEDIEVTVRVDGTRPVVGDVFVNGNPTGPTTLALGDNTLTFPASSGFSFRISNLMATTGGCAAASPLQVSYSPQVSQLNADIPLPLSGEFTACGENTVASIAVQTGNGIGPYSFAWSTGDTTNTISNVGQGTYSVTITDNLGCTSSTSVEVTAGDTLAYTLSTIDPICPDGQGSISISLDELPQNAQFRFDLPGLDPVTSADLSFDNLASGTYVFQLIQENGCDQSTLITIDDPVFYDIIRFDTVEILLGDSARLFLDLPNALDSIRWFPGDYIDCDTCERVLVSPPFDLEYEAVAYTTEGCEVSDLVYIRVAPLTEIYIPTAFSPNGDRINDILIPYGGPEVDLIESFMVFDRWGNSLHRSVGFQPGDELFGWDGRHRGTLMNSAVFVAVAEVRYKNGTVQTFTSDVTLIR